MSQEAQRLSLPTTSLRVNWRTFAAVTVTIISWASAFPGIRAGLQGYTPEHLALLRYLTASAVLAGYALATRMPLPQRRDIPGIALVGALGITIYNIALNTGEQGVSAGVASLIVAAAPVFVAILAGIFFRERLRAWGWLGIAASFVGVGVIALGTGTGFSVNPKALLVLAAAVAQILFFVSQKPFLKRYSALQLTTYAIWMGSLFLLVFAPDLLPQIQSAPPSATLAIIYLGIFPGAIGYACWSYVLARIPASIAASFLYLVPAFAIVIAWVWLGEKPSLITLGGGLLVICGVVIVNTYGKRPKG
jgi:drug/metabolite transporter (DMT)-like permease